MKKKHRNDKNHGRNGWVGGNPRYSRKGATAMSHPSTGWHEDFEDEGNLIEANDEPWPQEVEEADQFGRYVEEDDEEEDDEEAEAELARDIILERQELEDFEGLEFYGGEEW